MMNKSTMEKSNEITTQLFVEIPNVLKKLKKIERYTNSKQTLNYIIHEYGKYAITHNNIIDVTNIPFQCYDKTLTYKDNLVKVFINKFNKQQIKNMSHIPINKFLVRTEKTLYKLHDTANVTFVIENHIVFNENSQFYDLDFNDEDNDTQTEYYFEIDNDSEDSYFVKEDIFSFLKHLN